MILLQVANMLLILIQVANMLRQSYTARTESVLDDNTLDFIKEFKDSKVIPLNRLRENEVPISYNEYWLSIKYWSTMMYHDIAHDIIL